MTYVHFLDVFAFRVEMFSAIFLNFFTIFAGILATPSWYDVSELQTVNMQIRFDDCD